MRDVLCADGAFRRAVVSILPRACLPQETDGRRNVVNQLAPGIGHQEAKAVRKTLVGLERASVIDRKAIGHAEGVDAGVLRIGPQQLAARDCGKTQSRGRIGNNPKERIRHLILQFGSQAQKRSRL